MKAATGSGQLASMTPSSSPFRSRSARTARAPPGVPVTGALSVSGRPALHHRSAAPRATRCAGQSSCGGICRQRPASPPDRPAAPSSASAPSASSSQSTTAAAPRGVPARPAVLASSAPSAANSAAASARASRTPGLPRSRSLPPPRLRRACRMNIAGQVGAGAPGIRRQDGRRHLGEGTPVAAASPASWLAASAEDSPSRSISDAPGHRDHGLFGGRGADTIKLTPLMVDDRDQPQHVIIAACSHHPPPWGTRLHGTVLPAQWAGLSEPGAAAEACSAHDSYIRSTIGIDRTTVPDALVARRHL